MTSLHVICSLGPPNQKSWLRLWYHFSLVSKKIPKVYKKVVDRHSKLFDFTNLSVFIMGLFFPIFFEKPTQFSTFVLKISFGQDV